MVYSLLFTGLLSLFQATVALECFTCSNVTELAVCHSTVICGNQEKCFTKLEDIAGNWAFTLGCRPESQCVQPSTGIIGREVAGSSPDLEDPRLDCDQCCSVNYCNKQLCSNAHSSGSGSVDCEDSPGFNCELVSATFNICKDVHHAKFVCKKWCGLCNLVDGGWSGWGEWSLCERTCGHSQRIRLRECTDPAPAHGGLACPGYRAEFDNCTGVPCPAPSGSQPAIYFTVTTPTGHLFQENVPIFSVVVVNEGHAYDQSTGQFVAPVSGVYEFYVAFISTNSTTQCFVRQNRKIMVYALTNGGGPGWQSASASTFLHCYLGDHVDLSCGGWQYVDHNASAMFTGALMHED